MRPGNASRRRSNSIRPANAIVTSSQLLEELKTGPHHLERLVIKNGGRVFFLNVQDVYCIESEGNYVRVYDNQKGYLLRETISSLEEQLDPKQFRRIHRSAIVKIDRIKEMQPWFHGEYRIIMENGKQLTLSRNYRSNFQRALGNALILTEAAGAAQQEQETLNDCCPCLLLLPAVSSRSIPNFSRSVTRADHSFAGL